MTPSLQNASAKYHHIKQKAVVIGFAGHAIATKERNVKRCPDLIPRGYEATKMRSLNVSEEVRVKVGIAVHKSNVNLDVLR